jgi:serine/threonine-protein kinase RsbW
MAMSDPVVLSFPADTQNVALARTVAAAMASRADLPIDQLEDLRLAVSEAVALLIAEAPEGATIECAFHLDSHALQAALSSPAPGSTGPATDTFSWTILRALLDDVTASADGGRLTLTLRMNRTASADLT